MPVWKQTDPSSGPTYCLEGRVLDTWGLMPSVPGDPKMVSFLKKQQLPTTYIWKLLNIKELIPFLFT